MAKTARTTTPRARMATAFGWLAGGSAGLLVNYGIFLAWGGDYPVVPTTFVLFVAGCFGGMFMADRLGPRGFRVMGLSAGILMAVTFTLAVVVLVGSR